MIALRSNVAADFGEFGTWDKVSGGGLSQRSSSYNPGGSKPVIIPGVWVYGDITIVRAFDALRDMRVISWVKQAQTGQRETKVLTLFVVGSDRMVTSIESYTVSPKDLKFPEGENGSDQVTLISLTLDVHSGG
jgi:hypothetical protein